ncbi:MAG: sigma-70 family RNA polymerase sigma factor [Armatimonadetes bacterium]|nr:sigma-70 family RNA polymerase sigma factor [Armatimonadota bacterium]
MQSQDTFRLADPLGPSVEALPAALTSSAASAQDRALFESLAERHYRQAYHIAYRLTGSHVEAEDLTQEAMIRAYQSFHRYRRDLPFANWLYRIIVNLHIDALRRRPKAWIDSVDDLPGAVELPDLESDPADQVISQQLDVRLQQALGQLSREFRTAVVLCDVEGLSYEEIAEVMQCSIGTVRSRIHRGRNHLRRLLGVT